MILRRGAPWIVLPAAAVVWSCGGGDARGKADAAAAAEQEAVVSAAASDAASGDFDRESFVLCPALEEHREELVSIVSFEQDAEWNIQRFGSECIVRGRDTGFVRVAVAPAITGSVAMHVRAFDAETSPAPEVAPDAVFVDVSLQPHVVFSMGALIIDVDAEAIEAPNRQTMIALATRVREILAEANR